MKGYAKAPLGLINWNKLSITWVTLFPPLKILIGLLKTKIASLYMFLRLRLLPLVKGARILK
jgi:hypothetical protein